MAVDFALSGLPAAATPLDSTSVVYVVVGGVSKKTTVGALVNATSPAALVSHLTQSDPFVHTADKIASASTVGQGDVEADLSRLNASKADVGTLLTGTRIPGSTITPTVNVNNVTTEANLFSFTLPANTLKSDGDMLAIEAGGDILANSGAPTFTWKMKAGAAVLATPATAIAVSTNQRRWKLRSVIRRTTVGSVGIESQLLISQAIATTQWNVFDPLLCYVGNLTDFASLIQFDLDATIAFSVQMSVQSTNNRVRMYGYTPYKVIA